MEFNQDFKVNKGLEILGFNEELNMEDKSFIMNELSNYIFNTKSVNNGEKTFDLELDYKYYFIDFLKLGYNLNKDEISWWEFDSLLEGIFLSKDSAIGQVLQYRTYEKPSKSNKTSEDREHKFYQEKKRQYALPNPQKIDNGLGKLWSFIEQKVVKNDE